MAGFVELNWSPELNIGTGNDFLAQTQDVRDEHAHFGDRFNPDIVQAVPDPEPRPFGRYAVLVSGARYTALRPGRGHLVVCVADQQGRWYTGVAPAGTRMGTWREGRHEYPAVALYAPQNVATVAFMGVIKPEALARKFTRLPTHSVNTSGERQEGDSMADYFDDQEIAAIVEGGRGNVIPKVRPPGTY